MGRTIWSTIVNSFKESWLSCAFAILLGFVLAEYGIFFTTLRYWVVIGVVLAYGSACRSEGWGKDNG
jgi:hypothetical protein